MGTAQLLLSAWSQPLSTTVTYSRDSTVTADSIVEGWISHINASSIVHGWVWLLNYTVTDFR